MTSIVIAAATALVLQVASPERQKELLAEIHAKNQAAAVSKAPATPVSPGTAKATTKSSSRPVVQSSGWATAVITPSSPLNRPLKPPQSTGRPCRCCRINLRRHVNRPQPRRKPTRPNFASGLIWTLTTQFEAIAVKVVPGGPASPGSRELVVRTSSRSSTQACCVIKHPRLLMGLAGLTLFRVWHTMPSKEWV